MYRGRSREWTARSCYLDLRRTCQVRACSNLPGHQDLTTCSELASPLSTLSTILGIASSSPSFAALALQAVAKIFSHHCASVSQKWLEQAHQETKNLLSSIRAGVIPFASQSDTEVQERAAELLQLLSFIDADLTSHQPPLKKIQSDIPGMKDGFESAAEDHPSYPKSLFLLPPLFSSYELNAVALQAQSSISIPDGLDLEHDLVPGGGFPTNMSSDEFDDLSEDEKGVVDLGEGGSKGMDELRKVLRAQEEEEKERRKGRKVKGKERKAEGEVTSVEDRAERAKVSLIRVWGMASANE